MTSDGSMLADAMLADAMLAEDGLADEGDIGLATERDVARPELVAAPDTPMHASSAEPRQASGDAKYMDSRIVEELTNRLPTSELVKIIKNALECGRRNVPFTESDLLRAMTFGSSFAGPRQSGGRQPVRAPRSTRS